MNHTSSPSRSDGSLQHTAQQIKERISIEEFIGKLLDLKKSGANYVAICPFHSDHHPSFTVYPGTRSYTCFGCHASGDVIDFYMRWDSIGFPEAVIRLAAECGITVEELTDEEKKVIDKTRIIDEIRDKTALHYKKSFPPEEKAKFREARCFSDESVERFHIGYAAGGLKKHLVEECHYPVDLCVEAGVLSKKDDGEIRDFFFNRIIFPVFKGKRVVNLVGRKIASDGPAPKYLHLRGEIRDLYNEDALRNEVCGITEGAPDTITADQYGLPSVGLLGKTFKSEWASRFSRCTRVYVILHLHEQGGIEKALEIAEALGDKARIVSIPDGKDLNEYMLDHAQVDFDRLLAEANDAVQFEIKRIPADIGKIELARRIEPILRLIAKRDEPIAEGYLSFLHSYFKEKTGLTKDDVKAYRDRVKQLRSDPAAREAMDEEPVYVWENNPAFNPAQDFIGENAYFTIYIPTKIEQKVIRVPRVITSNGEVLPMDPQFLRRYGIRLRRDDLIPSDLGRWSLGMEIPNSVYKFLNEGATVDPAAIFSEIKKLLVTYIDFPDPRYHDFLALWCMGTYVFMAFESYPYILLNATKRSGKTRTIEIMAPICFNSIASASMSDAAMFRSIECNRCTIFVDEADKYKGKSQNDLSERFEIFNSGYKKSGSVWRCVGDDHIPQEFSTYGPKILANIKGLDETAADRTVTLNLLRAKKPMTKYISRMLTPIFQSVRDSLYVMAMRFHREIASFYQNLINIEGLKDREDELWGPILTLAEFVDRYRLKIDPNISHDDSLSDRMMKLAIDCRDRKMEIDAEENKELRILEGVIDYRFDPEISPRLDESGRKTEFYSSDELLLSVQSGEGMGWVKKNYLARVLSRLRILRDKNDKLHSREAGPGPSSQRKQVMYYRLNEERLADIADRQGLKGLLDDARMRTQAANSTGQASAEDDSIPEAVLALDSDGNNAEQNAEQNVEQAQMAVSDPDLQF